MTRRRSLRVEILGGNEPVSELTVIAVHALAAVGALGAGGVRFVAITPGELAALAAAALLGHATLRTVLERSSRRARGGRTPRCR